MGYFITLCVGFLLGSILGLVANKKLKKRYQEEFDKLKKLCQEELEKTLKKEG